MRTIMLSLLFPVVVLAQDITISSGYHASVTSSLRLNQTSVGIGGSVILFDFDPGRDQFRLTSAYYSGSTVGGGNFRTLDRLEFSGELVYSPLSSPKWFLVGQIGFEISHMRRISGGQPLRSYQDDWFGGFGLGMRIVDPVAATVRYLGGRGNEGIRFAVEYGL